MFDFIFCAVAAEKVRSIISGWKPLKYVAFQTSTASARKK